MRHPAPRRGRGAPGEECRARSGAQCGWSRRGLLRDRARTRVTVRMRWSRWAALALYVAAVYAILPYGPRIGLGLIRTGVGSWLLGPGLAVLAVAGIGALLVLLGRRGAPLWAYVALAAAGVCYVVAFSWLRAQRLE